MNKKRPELKIDPVPTSAYGNNCRTLLPNIVWTIIREEVLRLNKYKCKYCIDTDSLMSNSLECHEVWKVKKGLAVLTKFECVCRLCHAVHHYGFHFKSGAGDEIKAHAMKINNWSEERFISELNKALDRHSNYDDTGFDIGYALTFLMKVKSNEDKANKELEESLRKII